MILVTADSRHMVMCNTAVQWPANQIKLRFKGEETEDELRGGTRPSVR